MEEIVTPVDGGGAYAITPGEAYGPAAPVWRYGDEPAFFSRYQGGAFRMPNGNTLITEAIEGRIIEVTTDGTIVWTHFTGESVHKAPRYWTTGTAVGGAPPPTARLLDAAPNPFNPATTVAFEVSRTRWVTLEVFDPAGRRVAVLTDGVRSPGVHEVEWNGRDAAGSDVASGVYVIRLDARGDAGSLRITLLR